MFDAFDQRSRIGRRGLVLGGAAVAASACVPSARSRLTLEEDGGAAQLGRAVLRYARFGDQRTGGPADRAVADWLERELADRRVNSRADRFTLPQLTDPFAEVILGDARLEAFPQWRHPTPPDGLRLEGRLAALTSEDLRDAIAFTPEPVPTGAYWPAASDAPVLDAAARGARAVVVTPNAPNGGLFAYNRDRDDPDFPIPVVIVSPQQLDALRSAAGRSAVVVTRSPAAEVESANVIGDIPARNGDRRRLVVSTPRTGWFRSGAERGGGVALWIALAGFAAQRLTCAATFVATTGHEVGHLGMKRFMANDAWAPADTTLWLHLGASIAAQRNGYPVPPPSAQQVFLPLGERDRAASSFADIGYTVRTSEAASPGETGEIAARGYPAVIGFAGHHPSFHTPEDDGSATDPDVLEAVRLRLQAVLAERFA